MASGVEINRTRKKEVREVDLITPHGAHITVTPTRAEELLKRSPIQFGDDVSRKYVREGDNPVVETVTKVSGAKPPRVGNRANTEEDGEVG